MQFLCGRHALVPWTYTQHLHVVQECASSFILDSGAFTIWLRNLKSGGKAGGKLDVAGYIDWCEGIHRHPGFDWAIIPDVIDGSEADNDAMLNDWPGHINGVPVYHLHESLERAERLSSWPIVAIGSSGEWPTPGKREWWQRMNEVRSAFCDADGVPRCKLHGLRMLDPKVFSKLPLHSADSTNCGRNSTRNGKALDPKFKPWQGATLTAWRIERHNSSAAWMPKKIKPKKNESSGTLFDLHGSTSPMAGSLSHTAERQPAATNE